MRHVAERCSEAIGRERSDRRGAKLRGEDDSRRVRLAGTERWSELRGFNGKKGGGKRGGKGGCGGRSRSRIQCLCDQNHRRRDRNERVDSIAENVRHERDDGEDDSEETWVGGVFEYGFEREERVD